MLLLLRVFSLAGRSESLFDALSKVWRPRGPMAMIAGPDLATSAIEPHEFLDYIGGRLDRAYVQSSHDLEQRIASLDRRRDPDGRFRVNEFFCRSDTWKQTMASLSNQCDAILMDLRSFSATNQGCLFKLEQLVHHVPLQKVLLLVDDTTDNAFLEEQLQEIWSRLDAGSPNRDVEDACARVYHGGDNSDVAMRPLFAGLDSMGRR